MSLFKAVSSEYKDAYNLYQLQLRINIEYAFGILVNRWAVLRSPIPLNISLTKKTSLVRNFYCLHNWLIYEKQEENQNTDRVDAWLDGEDHVDDIPYRERRNCSKNI